MKKINFENILLLIGSFGYLIISLYIAENPHVYNGKEGIFISLQATRLLIPYIIFCMMGIIGLAINLFKIKQY